MVNVLKQLIPLPLRKQIAVALPFLMPDERKQLVQHVPKNSVGLEIGVHEGDFSQQLLRAAQPRELHLIDPWLYIPDEVYERSWFGTNAGSQAAMDQRYETVQKRFAPQIASGQVTIYRALSHDVVNTFDDHFFDWIYIDGDHTYDAVRQDLQDYYPKIKRGGLLMGDDYGIPGWWEAGVTRAVDEFVAEHQLTLSVVGDTQFLIRV